MATTKNPYRVWTLKQVIGITNKASRRRILTWDSMLSIVRMVPREQLGNLILEAEHHASPLKVQSRVGITSRYPEDWETYLRETLASIIAVILNLELQ